MSKQKLVIVTDTPCVGKTTVTNNKEVHQIVNEMRNIIDKM